MQNVLLENQISWTGNVPTSGYSDFYSSRIENKINFDLRNITNLSTIFQNKISFDSNNTLSLFENQKNTTTGTRFFIIIFVSVFMIIFIVIISIVLFIFILSFILFYLHLFSNISLSYISI